MPCARHDRAARASARPTSRLTAFATNTPPGGPGRQLADLELRHRRRAHAEDRIRTAKDTGLRNLPLHEMNQNRIWCADGVNQGRSGGYPALWRIGSVQRARSLFQRVDVVLPAASSVWSVWSAGTRGR